MPWMNDPLLKSTRKAVAKHCCNFTGTDGCLFGGTCRYFRDLLADEEVHRCAWAEDAVLANDPAIETVYFDRLHKYLGHDDTPQREMGTCKDCRKDYVRKSNRQVRCPECQAKASKKSHAVAKRKYRNKGA